MNFTRNQIIALVAAGVLTVVAGVIYYNKRQAKKHDKGLDDVAKAKLATEKAAVKAVNAKDVEEKVEFETILEGIQSLAERVKSNPGDGKAASDLANIVKWAQEARKKGTDQSYNVDKTMDEIRVATASVPQEAA